VSSQTVSIDCLPASVSRHGDASAIVAVDVLRSTTTAVTCLDIGRRCFPVASAEQAAERAALLDNPLLVGEVRGHRPPGFEMDNSPSELATRSDRERPVILLSSSGTPLLCAVDGRPGIYAACLRNLSAQVAHLVEHHDRVVLIGAGSRGEFREEDQLCCAWIAERLADSGFAAGDGTRELIARWSGTPLESILASRSASYLSSSGRDADVAFVLDHYDDCQLVTTLRSGELVDACG
jgi:2-phosphosulfolactate phosphatase